MNKVRFNTTQIQELISVIKQKKELRGISDPFVQRELEQILHGESGLVKRLQERWNPRSPEYETVVKKVRERLRRVYGLFRPAGKEFTLETHPSTRERISFYPELYRKLFALTGTPRVILDVGCGINPLSLPFMGLKEVSYYAYDVSQEEISVLNSFFQQWGQRNPLFTGKAEIRDIRDTNTVAALPRADVAFLFKVTDVLDRGKGHTRTEKVLDALPARYLVVSFSTRTMSGKKMTAPRRRWMEWLCQRRGWGYHLLEFENELFYMIEKESIKKKMKISTAFNH